MAAIAAMWEEDGRCCVLLVGSGYILRGEQDYEARMKEWMLWLGEEV
jgi:hypothetical protein